jgi:hypothetical protein
MDLTERSEVHIASIALIYVLGLVVRPLLPETAGEALPG